MVSCCNNTELSPENVITQPTSVPLLDLKRQHAAIASEIHQAVNRVFESQCFILGTEVTCFEEESGKYCQSPYALGVSSGTDALLMALMAAGVTTGDEVITTPYSFFATVGSIARLNARPIFVDIDPLTYNIDARKIEEKITSKTKAIMPVHLFGQMADMSEIMDIANRHRLVVIEDAAQAIGSDISGKRSGSFGQFGCFSFFPSKNLGCAGDGGLVTTSRTEHMERLKALRNHGQIEKYYHSFVGGNFRLDALQAAILRVKLPHLEKWTELRQKNAGIYRKLFSLSGLDFEMPYTVPGFRHIYNQFVIRVPQRQDLIAFLRRNNIGCEVYYPLPLHLQKCFSDLGYKEGDFPHAEKAARDTIALPIFPELTEDEQKLVVDTISSFYKKS